MLLSEAEPNLPRLNYYRPIIHATGKIAPSMQPINARPFAVLAAVGLLLVTSVGHVSAQLDTSGGSPATSQEPPAADKQPHLIDAQVESTVGAVTAYINKVRSENFPLYLTVYSAVIGTALGISISLLGYRLSDPRSAYSQLRQRGSLLAMTCGGASGVLLAVLKAPVNLEDKLTVLLMSIVSGCIAGLISAHLTFITQRYRSSLIAKKEGRVMGQRIGRR